MKRLIVLLIIFCANTLFAQNGKCVKGNCVTGTGKLVNSETSYYEGQFVNGHFEGIGTFEDEDKIYKGEWKNGWYNGKGKLSSKNHGESVKQNLFYHVYEGSFINGVKNGTGLLAYFVGKDTSDVYNGNFKDGEFFGKGSFHVFPFCIFYSDSWTDSKNFTRGTEIRDDTKVLSEGSYVNLNFERDSKKNATVSNNKNSNNSGASMLDYGVFNTKKNDNTEATKTIHDYKVYCFVTTCTQGKRSFKVLSKITADINKHSFDEIKNEAAHRISNNGWYAQGSIDYLGTADNINVEGKAGRDYVVSETAINDF